MAGNSFGKLFTLTTFGESHGMAIGGVIDGCPSGVPIDLSHIASDMQRRRPGQSSIVSPRNESDDVQILSGIFEGRTTGTPIAFIIKNSDIRSDDYDHLKSVYRPGHADITYDAKYGFRDHRGGGRASARETAVRVAAGAIAKQLIAPMQIQAYVSAVGNISVSQPYTEMDLTFADQNAVRCPHPQVAREMEQYIAKLRDTGDSVGGVITCVISNVTPGLGEPVFDKLHAVLGHAMLSINAVKGFEYGSGFNAARMHGSDHNDPIIKGKRFFKNNAGGVLGGISNGEDIYFNVAFKPVSTIMQDQHTVDQYGEPMIVEGKGRHDPCVVPRAVPIVEAMAALVMADFFLMQKINQLVGKSLG